MHTNLKGGSHNKKITSLIQQLLYVNLFALVISDAALTYNRSSLVLSVTKHVFELYLPTWVFF